jgi:hypothetical protein
MRYGEFKTLFPTFVLADEELRDLLQTGFVAVKVDNKRVFTLRIEAEESDIPAQDVSKFTLRLPKK